MNRNTNDEHTIRFLVRQQKPPRFTTTDVAKAVGRSVPTIVRWRRQGLFVPTEVQRFGKTDVYLYSEADLRAMKQLAAQQKPGRKAMSQQGVTTPTSVRRNGNVTSKKGQWAGNPKKKPASTIAQRRRHH